MKLYKVKVNGKLYEVELESVEETASSIEAPVARSAKETEGTKVLAPIGGKVVDIKVSAGAKVKKGDCLLIIEAMKLENEVVAPCDGTVVSIASQKGAVVASKDLLIILG